MSGSGGIDARERDPAASDGGRSECDKKEARALCVHMRSFIGGVWERWGRIEGGKT